MKIKMRIKYRKAWLFIVGVALLFAVLGAMTVAFISEHNYGFAVLCLLLGIVILIATHFRFNYGTTINDKRLIAIEQAGIKILRYDDISGIIAKFTNESIVAYIKMKNQQEHVLVGDSVFLGTNVVLPSKNKIKLHNKFVEESILNLSRCPKVKIQNFYRPQ